MRTPRTAKGRDGMIPKNVRTRTRRPQQTDIGDVLPKSEYMKDLEFVSQYNLDPMPGLAVGIFLIARNWERQTGETLLSLSVEDIVNMFGRLPLADALKGSRA